LKVFSEKERRKSKENNEKKKEKEEGKKNKRIISFFISEYFRRISPLSDEEIDFLLKRYGERAVMRAISIVERGKERSFSYFQLLGGFDDKRMPGIEELKDILERYELQGYIKLELFTSLGGGVILRSGRQVQNLLMLLAFRFRNLFLRGKSGEKHLKEEIRKLKEITEVCEEADMALWQEIGGY